MTTCSIGDQIVCHIYELNIVSIYSTNWDYKHIFEIISAYDEGYMIYIPNSLFIKSYIEILDSNYKKYNLDKKFVGSAACYVSSEKIVSIYSKVDGMHCSVCKDFIQMAEPNQEDGGLICWSCSNYKIYKSRLT